MAFSEIMQHEDALRVFLGTDNLPALDTEDRQIAARAITDAMYGTTPDWKIKNAVAWVARAREEGKKAGVLEERERWEAKIKKLFDVK